MIVIGSKNRKIDNLERDYPGALFIDVTSRSEDEFVRLSPFYPHGCIPVPFSLDWTSASVEGIWQGLKVFEQADIDTMSLRKPKDAGAETYRKEIRQNDWP